MKKVVVVDENDLVIGAKYLDQALQDQDIRRAARVFVFDTEGNFLVQKRSAKVRKPLLFDQSVGGHVDEGESYHEAAVREMAEEIGLENVELSKIALSWRNPEFFNGIFKATIAVGTELKQDQNEIEELLWMSPSDVDNLVNQTPEKCTDAFVEIWKTFRDKLVS